MKKLTTILLATFFICTASYGATIKELLGNKKSIKLVCTVEKAKNWFDILDVTDSTPGWKGYELFVEIKEKSFTKSDSYTKIEYLSGITPSDGYAKTKDGKRELLEEDGRIEINDNYYLLSHSMYLPSDKNYKDTYLRIKINRYSSKFNYSEKEYNGLHTELKGTCEKAIDKKF